MPMELDGIEPTTSCLQSISRFRRMLRTASDAPCTVGCEMTPASTSPHSKQQVVQIRDTFRDTAAGRACRVVTRLFVGSCVVGVS